jgi:regulatory protein
MLITKLERQKKRRHRVSVYLDGDFAFGCNDEVIYRFGLHKGMELDEGKRKEVEQYDQRVQAKLAAERLVGLRMRSEQELRKRLKEKEISEEIIDETVETFTRVGLLNDRAFAEAFVRDRLRLRPRAASLLRRELRSRGIAADIIDAVLSAQFGETDEDTLIRSMAEHYVKTHPRLEPLVIKRRLAGFLQRKGFSSSLVYRTIKALFADD